MHLYELHWNVGQSKCTVSLSTVQRAAHRVPVFQWISFAFHFFAALLRVIITIHLWIHNVEHSSMCENLCWLSLQGRLFQEIGFHHSNAFEKPFKCFSRGRCLCWSKRCLEGRILLHHGAVLQKNKEYSTRNWSYSITSSNIWKYKEYMNILLINMLMNLVLIFLSRLSQLWWWPIF